MQVYIRSVKLRIDFSFILIVSFAVLYGYKIGLQIFLFSVLHELGHLAALLIFGAEIKEIDLSFFGFGIRHDSKLSNLQEAAMLLCGPFVNLCLFAALRDEINLALFVLNMQPVYPLDGGRLLLLAFPNSGRKISTFLLIILLIFSILLLVKFRVFSLLLISVYLLLFNMRFV